MFLGRYPAPPLSSPLAGLSNKNTITPFLSRLSDPTPIPVLAARTNIAFDFLNDLNGGRTSSYVTLSQAPKSMLKLRYGKDSTE
jgi:hypothetical protein